MWVVLSGIDAGHWMLLSAPVPIGPMDLGLVSKLGLGRGVLHRIGTMVCQLISIQPGFNLSVCVAIFEV